MESNRISGRCVPTFRPLIEGLCLHVGRRGEICSQIERVCWLCDVGNVSRESAYDVGIDEADKQITTCTGCPVICILGGSVSRRLSSSADRAARISQPS